MIRSRMAFVCALSVSGVALATAPAHAQGSQSSVVAEALYQDGVRLMKEGHTPEACAKFAASQRADASTGTLINLAVCHEKQGKTASAWAEFTDAASQASRSGQRDRETYARDHAATLEKQLHRLVLEMMKPEADIEVKLDGEVLGSGALGTAIPLDPGEHDLVVSAPGKKAWTQKVRLGPGAVTERMEVPALENGPSAAAGPDGAVPRGGPGQGSLATAPAADTVTAGSPTKKIVGFALLGVGAVGLGVGTYYLVRSIQLEKDANAVGSNGQFLNANHESLRSDAQVARTLSIVSGVTGVVAAGVGVYLVVTSAPSSAPKTARGVRLLPSGDVSGARLDLFGVW